MSGISSMTMSSIYLSGYTVILQDLFSHGEALIFGDRQMTLSGNILIEEKRMPSSFHLLQEFVRISLFFGRNDTHGNHTFAAKYNYKGLLQISYPVVSHSNFIPLSGFTTLKS